MNTEERDTQDQEAQTLDTLPHAVQRRPTVDRLIDQLETKTATTTHFWLSRQSSYTDVEMDHSISEMSVAADVRRWDSLNIGLM